MRLRVTDDVEPILGGDVPVKHRSQRRPDDRIDVLAVADVHGSEQRLIVDEEWHGDFDIVVVYAAASRSMEMA
jgi:hypothetical protein